MKKYYEIHSDQLSEKIKDQYDSDVGDIYFFVFLIIAFSLILFLV